MLQKKTYISILFISLFFFIFSLFMGKAARCTENEETLFKKATIMLNKGKYLESIGIYQDAARFSIDPDVKARAMFLIGRTYSLYLDQYQTALKQFSRLVKTYPGSSVTPDAVFNSGMVLFEQGKYQDAYGYFDTYIKNYPHGRNIQSAAVWADCSKSFKKTADHPQLLPVKSMTSDDSIRVLLKHNINTVTIDTTGSLTVLNPYSEEELYSGPGPVTLSKNKNYIQLNGQVFPTPMCHVISNSTTITLGKKSYRGFILISVEPESLFVVNNIQIEQYLYGVVPKEMPSSWEKQALMAQAIAARTYALYIKRKSRDKTYDIESTTLSQVYGGYNAETSRSNHAIDATRGQVMTINGKLIIAYFHSNSGGHTESPKHVWQADIPYLKGVPDKFSKNTPGCSWEYFLSYDATKKRLNKQGYHLKNINGLKISGKSASGRVLSVRISSGSKSSEMTGNHFRIKIGSKKIKSTLFNMVPHSNGVLFKGKGFGHGVGMSQWGARRMAQSGSTYQDILNHYYQGISIIKFSHETAEKQDSQNIHVIDA